jgi:hypothetical protein
MDTAAVNASTGALTENCRNCPASDGRSAAMADSVHC